MLDIQNLSVQLKNEHNILSDISININNGEILGIVGESGSGKTVLAMSILGILHHNLKVRQGTIYLDNNDILLMDKVKRRQMLGKDISYIAQNPNTALDELMTIGKQIEEVIVIHSKNQGKNEIKSKVYKLLQEVNLNENVYNKYPHELSGGMKQRVVIAIAIANNPQLIIADEPTTSLDVTVQYETLQLLKKIQSTYNISFMFISHNISVVQSMASKIAVMYSGEIVESGKCVEVLKNPYHPYTTELVGSIPSGKYNDNKILGTAVIVTNKIKSGGCVYYDRCNQRDDKCNNLINTNDIDGRKVKCILYE